MMADEYISREAALTELEDIGFYDDEPIQTRNRALKIIKNIPAADVRPVVLGKWNQVKPQVAVCSACGQPWTTNGRDMTGNANIFKALYHFCPNCGADMRGEKDG